MKILLVGGGSGGSVSPLLAVAEEIKKLHPKAEFLMVGSKKGPEKLMAENANIPFVAISSGKLRRYFSFKNILSPFYILVGLVQSLKIIEQFSPALIFGSGSFVQVPVVWAAWFKKIPVVLHQQDVTLSLANKLCQFVAKKITVTFESSLRGFSSTLGFFYKKREPEKIILTGNPFRSELRQGLKERAVKKFGLKNSFPTLLILGGGTGAEFLNRLTLDSLSGLTKTVQIIHSTGMEKFKQAEVLNYHPYKFISNMADAYAAADIVLSRAGLSTLTELSNLKKVSIIVPMPNSHQEINAIMLAELQAAIVLDQNKINSASFVNLIRKLLFAQEIQTSLKSNIDKIMPKNAGQKIAEIICQLAVKG